MDLESEPAPNEREWEVLAIQARYEYATRIFGVNLNARAILRVMMLHEGVWRVSPLAQITGIARSTVQSTLDRNIGVGLIARSEAGYSITGKGRGAVLRIHRETISIVMGEQEGFSAELIGYFRYAPILAKNPESGKILFPKNLREIAMD